MALQPPNIIYPNGNENIFSRQINIQWENVFEDTLIAPLFYEIFFTDLFRKDGKINWIQIASVASSSTSFLWNIPFYIKGDQCRIAIRTFNFKGERSDFSISAYNFSIQTKMIESPSVFTPVEGGSYFSYIPITLNNKGIINNYSRRALYKVYYSSESLGIDWTIVVDNLSVEKETFLWDIRSFDASSDYTLKVELVDGDCVSNPAIIKNIKINKLNFFILDTIPPKGKIRIKGDIEYTNQRDILLEMSSFDESTAIKSVSVQQADNTIDNIVAIGIEQDSTNKVTWNIKGQDGIKYLEANFKDYGNNINEITSETNRFFRTYFSLDNTEVTAFLIYNNDIWSAFGGKLYQNKDLIYSFSEIITSLKFYNNNLYIGLKDSDLKGILRRRTNSGITIINQFTDFESVINIMEVFDNNLYLGFENGNFYQFNGTSLFLLNNFSNSIINLFSDNSVIYIFLEGINKIVSYNGNDFVNINI